MPTRLSVDGPFAAAELVAFLAARAIPGVEAIAGTRIRRTLRDGGVLELDVRPEAVVVHAGPVAAARALCDLHCDAAAVDAVLSADPVLAPLVAARPGLRIPGAVDPFEVLVRAICGQQVSVAGARTTLGRLVARFGTPSGDAALPWRFPAPSALAGADPEDLGMPRARGRALVGAAAAVADGLDLADRDAVLALRGVGPWTVDYLRLRTHLNRDAFLPTDLIVRRAVMQRDADPERWRPVRGHAVLHLWAAPDSPGDGSSRC